jgi:hypothetical protein
MRKLLVSILFISACMNVYGQINSIDSSSTVLKNFYETKFEDKQLFHQTQTYYENKIKADTADKEAYCTLFRLYLQVSRKMYKQITDTSTAGLEKFNKLPFEDTQLFGDSLISLKNKASYYSQKCLGNKIEYEFD